MFPIEYLMQEPLTKFGTFSFGVKLVDNSQDEVEDKVDANDNEDKEEEEAALVDGKRGQHHRRIVAAVAHTGKGHFNISPMNCQQL